MHKKHFSKYILKYLHLLLFGIFVLIVIDYVQLEIPKNIGNIVNILDQSKVKGELETINNQEGYQLVFNYDFDEKALTWYKDDGSGDYQVNVAATIAIVNEFEVITSDTNVLYQKDLEDNYYLYWIDDIGNEIKIIEVNHLLNTLDNHFKDSLKQIVLLLIIIVVIVTVGRFLWRLAIFGTSRKIEYHLRNDMFNHATILSQDFYSHQKVGGMMTYFINDLNAVRMFMGPGLMMFVDSIFLGGFTLYRMFRLNVNLTLILLIPIIALMVGMIIINKSMRRQFRIRQEKFRDLSDYTQENFSGLSVIKAYVRETYEIMTFKRLSRSLYDTNLKFFKRALLVEIITGIAINIIVLVIIGFGSYTVIASQRADLNVGELTEYIALFMALSWPTRALARFLSINSQAQASAGRISEFLETKPTVFDNDPIMVTEIKPKIEAKNLNFMYPDGNELVLKDINFKIEAGEMVGVLGKTGSGKTTLVDILLRVYNVSEDTLLLGDYDIMKLPIKQVRNLVGYVPQDNFLFSDTIKNNIAFSKDFVTDEEIISSAVLADIYENVSEFKEGFETILGERGVTVSGGQKQRISIARALAKDPEILILDDSVSAVDTKTEETIISNLYKLRKGKTTIFIAHRISTVKDLDKIIIIDEGKIVGIGTHEELMKNSAFYQDIVRRQTLEARVEGGEF